LATNSTRIDTEQVFMAFNEAGRVLQEDGDVCVWTQGRAAKDYLVFANLVGQFIVRSVPLEGVVDHCRNSRTTGIALNPQHIRVRGWLAEPRSTERYPRCSRPRLVPFLDTV